MPLQSVGPATPRSNGYPTEQAAANAGAKALRRFLESEALKQEADKHSKPPKPPNDNAKAIDRWDDEGGAPSGGRSLRKRPRDFNQAAKLVVDIATGQVQDRPPTPEEQGKDPAAAALGRKGGAARAAKMSKKARSAAAKKAAKARWSD
jgi:hypothetical protein